MVWFWLLLGCGGDQGAQADALVGEAAAGVEEDCADGRDGDVDGLLDCEDADCADRCEERDCDDALDEDEDGLLDCFDEDCWGAPSCLSPTVAPSGTEVSSRVLGGYGRFKEQRRYSHTFWLYAYATTTISEGTAHAVWGTVRFSPPSTSATINCVWFAEEMSFRRRKSAFSSFYDPRDTNRTSNFTRTGVELNEGCEYSSSAFLPQGMSLRFPDAVVGAGDIWYQGAGGYHHWESYYYDGIDFLTGYDQTWMLSSFQTGETFTRTLP